MNDGERRAWDMFAAAALLGTFTAARAWPDPGTAAVHAASCADRLLIERQERMPDTFDSGAERRER